MRIPEILVPTPEQIFAEVHALRAFERKDSNKVLGYKNPSKALAIIAEA